MPTTENVPPSVERLLRAIGKSPDSIRVATSTDITRDGRFGERWLVGLDDRILVLDPAPSQASILVEVPYTEITEVTADPLVGGGVLNVASDGQKISLLHYSNTLSAKFSRVARTLQAIANNEEEPEEDEEQEGSSCPSCGRALPRYSKVCPHCLDKGKVLRRLFRYLLPYKLKAAETSLLMLLGTAISFAPVWLGGEMVDRVFAPPQGADLSRGQRVTALLFIVAGLLAVRIVSWAIAVARQQITAWLGGRITLDVRMQVYGALQRLSLAYFDKRQTGAVMSRVTQDTSALQGFLVSSAQYFIVYVLQLIGICIILFVVNWKLALIALSPAPLVSLLTLLFSRRLRFVYTRFWTSWSRLTAALSDSLSGIRVVRAFAQEHREIRRFEERSVGLFESEYSASRLVAVLFPTLTLLIELGLYPVWIVGGMMVVNTQITYGVLFKFTGYLGMFYGPLQWLTNLADTVPRSLTAAERVFEVLDTEPDVADTEQAVRLPRIEGDIEISNVTFGYDRNKPVLKDVSLRVRPGEMIGLVGKTGAGKSTIIRLLARFFDVTGGADEGGEVVVGASSVSSGTEMMKLADLEVLEVRALVEATDEDFCVFTGMTFNLVETMAVGACGAICPVPNFIPEKTVELYEACRNGDAERAQELQKDVFSLAPLLASTPTPHAMQKEALRLLGHPVMTHVKGPLPRLTSEQAKLVRETLENAGLI